MPTKFLAEKLKTLNYKILTVKKTPYLHKYTKTVCKIFKIDIYKIFLKIYSESGTHTVEIQPDGITVVADIVKLLSDQT